jgi:hypothetical protein
MSWIIISILLILIISIICIVIHQKKTENYTENQVDILDIKTDDKILDLIRKMLRDVDSLFTTFDIPYWIDGGTLLGAVRHQGIIPWDDDADICIDIKDLPKLLDMKNRLNEMGYGFVEFWGGYKIYPFSGLDIKHYNRNWSWQGDLKDVDGKENFNYLYPFIDVFVCQEIDGKVSFFNKSAKLLWGKKFWHSSSDLYPLRRYLFDGFYLNGPHNPRPYLDRGYGSDWPAVAYKNYDHQNQKFLPATKFQLTPIYKE